MPGSGLEKQNWQRGMEDCCLRGDWAAIIPYGTFPVQYWATSVYSPLFGWESSGGEFMPAGTARGSGQELGLPLPLPPRSLIWARHTGPLVAQGYIRTHNRLMKRCQGGVAGGIPPHKGGPEWPERP